MNKSQLTALVAAVVTQVMQAQAQQPKAAKHKAISTYKAANKFQPKAVKGEFSKRQLENDAAVAKAFAKQGLHVTPRVDALTYKGWLAKGQKVMPKSKGTFVKGVGTLFHSGQVSRDTTFDYLKTQEQAGSFPA